MAAKKGGTAGQTTRPFVGRVFLIRGARRMEHMPNIVASFLEVCPVPAARFGRSRRDRVVSPLPHPVLRRSTALELLPGILL